MTEEEAQLKRCCGPSDCGHESENGPSGPGRYCLGSVCMAWHRQTVMIDRRTNEPAIPGCPVESLEERYSAHGYCGLADKP